ncbi:IS66 family insertion sequence element accessory protein TnpB [Clostridium botulinum]|uniref:IS66 family insertion sequence element accessory protein TnpB n=1 Tax=Clostridium botulinum TaxID=1491 RepID=UPI003BFA71B4
MQVRSFLARFEKVLFIFYNKQIKRLKILHFVDEGFWSYYYHRLKNNKFRWCMTQEEDLKLKQLET